MRSGAVFKRFKLRTRKLVKSALLVGSILSLFAPEIPHLNLPTPLVPWWRFVMKSSSRQAAAWESQQCRNRASCTTRKIQLAMSDVLFWRACHESERVLVGQGVGLQVLILSRGIRIHTARCSSPTKQGWDSGNIRLDSVLYIPEKDAWLIYYSGTTTGSIQDRIGLAVCAAGADGCSGINPAAIQRVGHQPVLSPEPAARTSSRWLRRPRSGASGTRRTSGGTGGCGYSYRGKDGILGHRPLRGTEERGPGITTTMTGAAWARYSSPPRCVL